MANELRVFQDFLGGQLDAAIDDTDTTLSSPAFAAVAEIDTTNHILLTLDPDGVDGPPEVVKVTAHSAAATTCTVVRGQNGTTARAHADNTDWVAPVLANDLGTTYVYDGSDYVQSAIRIFIGPEDPADEGITPQEGDIWMDPS